MFASDFWNLTSFFFESPKAFDEKAARKQWKENTPDIMNELIFVLSSLEKDLSSQEIEHSVKEWISQKEIGFGKVMQPLRLSLVGALKGPHLFDIIHLIGIQEAIQRIEYAIKTL